MRDNPDASVKVSKSWLIRSHKRCWFIKTAGRWPWKSESAKECVTTHQPNELALKMDDAKARYLDRATIAYKTMSSYSCIGV